MINMAKYARQNKFLILFSLGMQIAVIEFARNVLKKLMQIVQSLIKKHPTL